MQGINFAFILLIHFSTSIPVDEFFQFGSHNVPGELRLNHSNEESFGFVLTAPFPFYDQTYTTLYINSNGVLSFGESFTDYTPTKLPIERYPLIAPFWSDVDTNGTGEVWYRETSDAGTLEEAKNDIIRFFPEFQSFQPQMTFIATWDKVGYYNSHSDKINTFQCVLASDGSLSFAIFHYADGEIQWTQGDDSNHAVAGFNAGNGNESETIDGSLTEGIVNVTLMSNTGVPGMFVFQIDGMKILSPSTGGSCLTFSRLSCLGGVSRGLDVGRETRLMPEMKFNCSGTLVGCTVSGRADNGTMFPKLQIWRRSDNESSLYHKNGPEIQIDAEGSVCESISQRCDQIFHCKLSPTYHVEVRAGSDIVGVELPSLNNQAFQLHFIVQTSQVQHVWRREIHNSSLDASTRDLSVDDDVLLNVDVLDNVEETTSSQPFHVTTTVPLRVDCGQETISGIIWPVTPTGTNATQLCPENPSYSVMRRCSEEGLWQEFDKRDCGLLAEQLEDVIMSATNLNSMTLEESATDLSNLVTNRAKVDETKANFDTISDIFSNFSEFISGSGEVLSEQVVSNMSQTINSLLQWTDAAISSSQTVKSFENILSRYAQQIEANTSHVFNFSSISLNVEKLSKKMLQVSGRKIQVVDRSFMDIEEIPHGQLSPQQDAAIVLPASIFENDLVKNQTDIEMYFGFYETDNLFPATSQNQVVVSGVLAAAVGQNINLQDLKENVTILFKIKDNDDTETEPGSERCVYWDFENEDWSTFGCSESESGIGTLTCHCNHLTNFAVLMNRCLNVDDCFFLPIDDSVNETLNRLDNSFTNLTTDNYESAVATLADSVEEFETIQNTEVLDSVAGYFKALKTFVNSTNVTVSASVVSDTVKVVNSLLQWEPNNVRVESTSSIVQSFETVISRFAQQLLLDTYENFTFPSLTSVAELGDVESFSKNGRSFTISGSEPILGGEDEVTPGKLHPSQNAAISLPASLFNRLNNTHTNIGIIFNLYITPTLFPVNQGRNISRNASYRKEVGSDVLAATVGTDVHFENLTTNVTIIFRTATEQNFTSPACASWDFKLKDWTPQGCTTNDTGFEDGIITCTCNHLTNFAVLVDICVRQDGCRKTSKVAERALTFVSFIGMSISIVFLLITILSLLMFRVIRKKDNTKYHVQLCLALLLMLLVSFVLVVFSAEKVNALYGGCVTVSVLVHYFTLVAIMWMGAEALLMFQKLVIVFVHITRKFIITVSIICWTVPIIVVIIPLIVDLAKGPHIDSDLIIKRAKTKEDISFCFLHDQGVFWGSFLALVLAVIVFNVTVFICVIVVLIRHTCNKAARMNETVSKSTVIRLMISISGVMFLFGLTWLIAILTFSVPRRLREFLNILFVVFNSLQGFFIFLFFVVFNKESLESWKEFFSCGKYRSKLLHPSLPSAPIVKLSNMDNTYMTSSGGGNSTSDTTKSDLKLDTLKNKQTGI